MIETSFIPVDRTKGTASFRLRTLKRSPKNQSPLFPSQPHSLLPPPNMAAHRRITLVLDVDETLVHSSFTPQPDIQYDKELMVTYNYKLYTIYVRYRPYLHEFLRFVSERFETVIFTASLCAYCDPLIDAIDENGILGNLRLFREHCTLRSNSYIKDLFLLGRDLGRIAIIDNSPTAYLFQQRNAIPIKSWFGDPNDQ
uniref:Carboxy-terminal domain RNA polymerase II polypeptide A small phosphatase 2 n=1 Tax=Lygus hesperus TaxID=30085 RepID=A0A0A9ZH66_LYGHE